MTTTSAGETTATFDISAGDGTVTLIERFAVAPDEVAAALEQARGHSATHWRPRTDYAGSFLLRHRAEAASIFSGPGDVSGFAVYSRWRPAAGSPPPTTVPDHWSLAVARPGAEVISSRTYTVDFTESVSTGSAGSPVSLTATPIAHMGIFSSFTSGQEPLLVQARKHSAESFGAGGVVGVNFLPSADGHDVINVGQWDTLDHLPSLSRQEGFAAADHYWDGLADFEGMFFDLVAVDPDPADSR